MSNYISYTSTFLRSVRKISEYFDYSKFSLSHTLMSRIVEMGLKKQLRIKPYRTSRAGRTLLHQIESLTSRDKTRKVKETTSGINRNNLIEVTKEAISTKYLDIAHVNVRSIRNKAPQFQLEISTQGIDICAITETWLKLPDEETIPLQQITPPGYNIISYPRSDGKLVGDWL